MVKARTLNRHAFHATAIGRSIGVSSAAALAGLSLFNATHNPLYECLRAGGLFLRARRHLIDTVQPGKIAGGVSLYIDAPCVIVSTKGIVYAFIENRALP